ncbi:unnamed protein product [Phaedon cochleariae]|uniref:Uncharacterized protein n=1 Tax=Phaedon cochleariae TaxID=80249 RepID=A0A9P0GQH8_PHACE|nr:unnamed protein product [Phaedon cochleariae]
MNHIKFTKDTLSMEQIFNISHTSSSSAVNMFIGTKNILHEYNKANFECEEFCQQGSKFLNNVCIEARSSWPHIENIVVYFRIGQLSEAETSIVVAVSSHLDKEAIKATEWVIDRFRTFISTWDIEISPVDSSASNCSNLKNSREINQNVEAPYIPPYLVQIKAMNNEIEERISRFMQRKRSDIDVHNIREFCCGERNSEFTCARVDAVLQKRKDSKSHLQVHRVLNSYQHRDQKNSNYLTQFIPPNGVEERLGNVESQLSLTVPVPKDIFQRLKLIEDRLLQLESISPEYIQFWDRVSLPTSRSSKKRNFCIDEVDDLITELEKQIKGN